MSELQLTLPLDEKRVRSFKAGDRLLLSGRIVTGRDLAHCWLAEGKIKDLHPLLENAAIYHCGPIMLRTKDGWTCKAAGPTSSIRQEPFMPTIIREYGLRCIIGKGGMGDATALALNEHGAMYCSAVGGAAVLYANAVMSVEKVYRLDDFGMPEALWVLQIKNFPLIVSMDAHGNSLHKDIEKLSGERLKQLF